MSVVMHCLKPWDHYIGLKGVVVWIDNVTLKYFAIQPKLSSKQVKWQNTLDLLNLDIWHKPGKNNVMKMNVPQKSDNAYELCLHFHLLLPTFK
jgi:hypothetical protein